MKAIALVSMLCLCGMTNSVQAQTAKKQPVKTDTPPAWMTQAWTADEIPYRRIQVSLKSDYQQGKNMNALTEAYKKEAMAQPKSPLAQFAWAVAARGSAKIADPNATAPEASLKRLQRVDPTNVHEFTLMRFVITQENQPNTPYLYVVGQRLMDRDPNNEFVKMPAIYALCRASKYTTALTYAQAWVKQSPANSKAQSTLAYVCTDLWYQTHNKMYASEALTGLQNYLRVAPSNDSFRNDAQHLVSYMQSIVIGHR